MENKDMEIDRCFEILETNPDASLQEAKQAYRDQVKFFHPDRFIDDPRQKEKAERKLKEINEAYERVKVFIASKEERQSLAEREERVGGEGVPGAKSGRRDVQPEVETKAKGETGKETDIIRSVGSFFSGMLRRIVESQLITKNGKEATQGRSKTGGETRGRGKGRGRGRGSR